MGAVERKPRVMPGDKRRKLIGLDEELSGGEEEPAPFMEDVSSDDEGDEDDEEEAEEAEEAEEEVAEHQTEAPLEDDYDQQDSEEEEEEEEAATEEGEAAWTVLEPLGAASPSLL